MNDWLLAHLPHAYIAAIALISAAVELSVR